MSKLKLAAIAVGAGAFIGHWVLHFAIAGALFAAIGLSSGGHDHAAAGLDYSDVQTIEAKALTDHGCDTGEWHFVINQISSQTLAPTSIVVTFTNGGVQGVPLNKFTGKVGHYVTTANLGSTVVLATATIYGDWGGQFNLSHGPCAPLPTPTPSSSPTSTPPPEPTPTPPPILTPTPTPIDPVASSWSATPIPDAPSPVQPIGFPDTGGRPGDTQ
ncbi:hypothetical protein LCGC14_0445960 [marine sediment metagenome]|uniref:Uncharacterized protein n=1 Tax=marine sediment metagenome TaxID=412755 RepID=A0A0F9SPV5_9ZZZZ